MRFFIALFSIILFGQAITEWQDGTSIIIVGILFLVSTLMGLYSVITVFSDAKRFMLSPPPDKSSKKVIKKSDSFRRIIKGNTSQNYRITNAIVNRVVIPPRMINQGFSLKLVSNGHNTFLFKIFNDLKGEVYSTEGVNIQISERKGFPNDSMKFTLFAQNARLSQKIPMLPSIFEREYRDGKLYFKCIIYDERSGREEFKAEGYLEEKS